MAERKSECGGFKVEGGKVKIGRQIVSRTLDEMTPYDVWGLQECMRCGVCRYACPFWLVTKEATDIPAWRTYEINKLFSMYYTGYGIVARVLRLRRLKKKEYLSWRESAYNCTACGACTDVSPLEIPNWYTALLMRRILHYTGMNIPDVEKWAENTKKIGNAMGIDKTQWENNAKSAGLSVDQKDAEILYVPSALEAQDINILSQIGIIAQGLRSKLTVSSEISDIGYYAYFAGDFEAARTQFTKIYEEAKKLNVKKILTSDGAGLFFLRWQGPKSLHYNPEIRVEHLTETVYNEMEKRNVKLDKADINDDITVHDSEFLSRLGGVEKPPREVLKAIIPKFKEPKQKPSSYSLFTCGHHLELINEKKEIVSKMRAYVVGQLGNLAKAVVTLDPNCKLSLENAVKENQGISKVYYYTEILAKAIKS
jgi:Fe-S oxidoreductase